MPSDHSADAWYDDLGTAGVVVLDASTTAGAALEGLRNAPGRDGLPLVLVTENERYVGFVLLSRLVLAAPERPIVELVDRQGPVLVARAELRRSASLYARYKAAVIVVVDEQGRPVGLVRVPRLLRALLKRRARGWRRWLSGNPDDAR